MPYQVAVLGSARLNNFRLDYSPLEAAIRLTTVKIYLDGVEAQGRILRNSLTIRDVINDTPNTCQFVVLGTAPAPGAVVRIELGLDTPILLFNGTLQTIDYSYLALPTQEAWACAAIDDTERLNRLRPYGAWANVSATTVAQE